MLVRVMDNDDLMIADTINVGKRWMDFADALVYAKSHHGYRIYVGDVVLWHSSTELMIRQGDMTLVLDQHEAWEIWYECDNLVTAKFGSKYDQAPLSVDSEDGVDLGNEYVMVDLEAVYQVCVRYQHTLEYSSDGRSFSVGKHGIKFWEARTVYPLDTFVPISREIEMAYRSRNYGC